MSTTRALAHRSELKTSGSLATRAGPARTFGGLVAFTALLFLCCGTYLIGDALTHPVAAHDSSVLTGACTIALASILFFYLLKPNPSRRLVQEEPRRELRSAERFERRGLVADARPAESPGSTSPRESGGDATRGRR
jgi:hypothetical protein